MFAVWIVDLVVTGGAAGALAVLLVSRSRVRRSFALA
jgi:hypothetical protein